MRKEMNQLHHKKLCSMMIEITLFKLKMDAGSLKSIIAPGGTTFPLVMSIELSELLASNAVIPLYPPPNGIIRHNPAAVDTS